MGKVTAGIRVADEVWIAAALLHREHPGAADFSLKEMFLFSLKEFSSFQLGKAFISAHFSSDGSGRP